MLYCGAEWRAQNRTPTSDPRHSYLQLLPDRVLVGLALGAEPRLRYCVLLRGGKM